MLRALMLSSLLLTTSAFLTSGPQASRLVSSPRSGLIAKKSITPSGEARKFSTRSSRKAIVIFASQGEGEDIGFPGLAATGVGVVAAPVVLWSEYTLWQTGCGLPAGPGGALGALEGISYLAVVGIAGWSLYTKVKTGKGLPPGPAGLLGAVEGLSFLALLAGAVVLGLTVKDYGSIPEAVPVEGGRCSGI